MGVTEQTLPERAAMASRRGSRVRGAWRRLAESCVCWPALTCIAVGVDWWTSRLIRPDSGRPRVCERWFKAVTGARRRLPCVWQRQTDEELKGPYPRHDAGGTVEQVPESKITLVVQHVSVSKPLRNT